MANSSSGKKVTLDISQTNASEAHHILSRTEDPPCKRRQWICAAILLVTFVTIIVTFTMI